MFNSLLLICSNYNCLLVLSHFQIYQIPCNIFTSPHTINHNQTAIEIIKMQTNARSFREKADVMK